MEQSKSEVLKEICLLDDHGGSNGQFKQLKKKLHLMR